MSALREAAQQALEALEAGPDVDPIFAGETEDALRDALAQEQPEPVAWLQPKTVDAQARPDLGYETCAKNDYGAFPVYRAPPKAEPVQEPVATTQQPVIEKPPSDYRRGYWDGFAIGKREGRIEAEDAAKQAEPKGGDNLSPPLHAEPDLSRCPQCNGPADNGHDRSIPPNPYLCTKCMAEPVAEIIESEIKVDSHQTLDDAMQRPRAMAQAYESGYKAGVAHEREACAKVCESRFMGDMTREDMEARRCAAAIRARGNT